MHQDHKQEVNELHTELTEKDEKIEQLIDDYENQLMVRTFLRRTLVSF